jgi:cyclic pyranopterin phosphate synthase
MARHARVVSSDDDTLTHLDERGRARMVDVASKEPSAREAVARATVRMQRATRARLQSGDVPKGDVWAVARIAGIQAAKRTHELIPLCHALALSNVAVEFALDPDGERVHVRATANATDRTGVEMEALTAAAIAALTLYDMLKSIDRGMTIEEVALLEKHGGRSGSYVRQAR